jgi:hypothetical protein
VTRRRRIALIVGIAAVALLVPVAIVAVPILTHTDQGVSVQEPTQEWPLSVTALGDDGRTRELMVVSSEPGATVDTAALVEGDRIVVSGTGYDASQGIYVAICVIPPSPSEKPGPCLGGVPSGDSSSSPGSIDFAPSNWVNDDWAWKLFGARGFDDAETGTFTAYLEVPPPVGEGIDCTTSKCAIYTRNDHTALRDRVQDVYLPVRFAD